MSDTDIVLECDSGCKQGQTQFTLGELTPTDYGTFKDGQTIILANMFEYTPGSLEFWENWSTVDTLRDKRDTYPQAQVKFRMTAWKKPDSDACEDFVFNVYSIIEGERRLVEAYSGIVLAITDV